MIRTRFAPSPTGFLHVGGLRTALYSYLFAKQNKGTFILRIEDTDQTREVAGAVENLIKTLKWAGIDFDEGPEKNGPHAPYIQSQRTEIYRKHAEILLEKNAAYRCFCTKERLEAMRKDQESRHLAPKYDRTCLNLTQEQIEEKLATKTPHVVRQKIPSGTVKFTDIIRGELNFDAETLDDQVLLKSDGFPTYHLANVVDDHLMEITHVIRGEEWLPSTPKHILLYANFGWEQPKFAHLPLLLNPDKSKLSKRQGDVAVEDYINKGYLREAIINFIALLGWHPKKDQEIFSIQELLEKFDLSRVQKGGAVFNLEKLNWLNGHYIRSFSMEELQNRITETLAHENWFNATDKNLPKYLTLIRERLKTLDEAKNMLKPFFVEHFKYDLALFENEKMKVDRKIAQTSLKEALETLSHHEDFETEDAIKAVLINVAEKLQYKNGQVLWPIRVALTNEPYSPGVFELIHALGKEKTLKKIEEAISALHSQ